MVGNTGILPLHRRPQLVAGLATALSMQDKTEAVRYWRHMARRLIRLAVGLGAPLAEAEADVRLLLQAARDASGKATAAGSGPI